MVIKTYVDNGRTPLYLASNPQELRATKPGDNGEVYALGRAGGIDFVYAGAWESKSTERVRIELKDSSGSAVADGDWMATINGRILQYGNSEPPNNHIVVDCVKGDSVEITFLFDPDHSIEVYSGDEIIADIYGDDREVISPEIYFGNFSDFFGGLYTTLGENDYVTIHLDSVTTDLLFDLG